jgi:dihydroxyacetone kinase
MLQNIVERVTQDEPQITKYDTIAGDGDCGETLLKGVKAVNEHFSPTSADLDLIHIFQAIATTVERSMDGTSGAIYAIFLNALASNSLSSNLSSSSPPISVVKLLSRSLSQALEELCRYTTARKGHRTLMDALISFVETFSHTLGYGKAVEMASEGADGTRKMNALLGRASYVGKVAFGINGVPDPGALGVVSVLEGILQSISAI